MGAGRATRGSRRRCSRQAPPPTPTSFAAATALLWMKRRFLGGGPGPPSSEEEDDMVGGRLFGRKERNCEIVTLPSWRSVFHLPRTTTTPKKKDTRITALRLRLSSAVRDWMAASNAALVPSSAEGGADA